MVAIPTLGRAGSLPSGAVTGRAGGNSVITSDSRGAPAGRPTPSIPDEGLNRSPWPDGPTPITRPSLLEAVVATPVTSHNRLIVRDRHILARIGRTTSGAEPATTGGTPNPDADGPPRPGYEMVDRSISWQIGTDHTAYLDNDAPHSATDAGNRRFPLGNQGSSPWEPVYGGTPGLYRPYGARGFVVGPAPREYALPGGPYRPGTLLDAGSPQDGPQSVYGGSPHGLHSPTVDPTAVTAGRYRDTAQQTPPRQWRPANSKIAGQSYSQTVVHQDGSGGGPLPRTAGGRQPGLNGRFR